MKLKERVIVKLFAGCEVDPGLRFELGRSSSWKQAQFYPHQELILTPYKGKEFLGIYVAAPGITLEKLRLIDEEIRRKIVEYCPKYNMQLFELQIFSQVFVA